MAELTPEIVDQVLAACRAGAEEAAEAFGRTLDAQIAVSVGESGTVDLGALAEELSGPGLAVVLTVGGAGALILLPESSGLVPEWYAQPDATGESRLSTLAQELGMLVLPEALMPEDFKAARVKNLAGALRRGGVGQGAAAIALTLSAGDKQGIARLVWPAPKPSAVIGTGGGKPKPSEGSRPEAPPAAAPSKAARPEAKPKPRRARFRDLPGHTRSLLRIKVPVVVTLAEKRQPVGRIIELGPGSIIQFDKSCEEMLELDVGDHPIASGEAVKVGDKFGLRITSIVLPEERFYAVGPRP